MGAQLFLFYPSLQNQLKFLRPGAHYIEPQAFIRVIAAVVPSSIFPTPASVAGLYWFTAAAGLLAMIGLATRFSLFVFAAGNWILVTYQYSYGEKHHPEALLCLFLMLLAFSPSGRRLSLDAWLRRRKKSEGPGSELPEPLTTAVWPLMLMQVLLSLAYFSGGLCKLVFGGIGWLNGYTLQQHMFNDALRNGLPLGLWMAGLHFPCIVLSVFTVATEVLFPITLFVRRSIPVFLVAGALLHIGIFFTMGAPFFQLIVLYSVYINFDRLNVPGRRFLFGREVRCSARKTRLG